MKSPRRFTAKTAPIGPRYRTAGRLASVETFDELIEGLQEAIALYLADDDERGPTPSRRLEVAEIELTDQPLPA